MKLTYTNVLLLQQKSNLQKSVHSSGDKFDDLRRTNLTVLFKTNKLVGQIKVTASVHRGNTYLLIWTSAFALHLSGVCDVTWVNGFHDLCSFHFLVSLSLLSQETR
jgi:hypothetical protein